MVDLSLNRPIYLALRDKFYLRAVNHLYENFEDWSLADRIKRLDLIMTLFTSTKNNALFAMRGMDFNPDEVNFIKCMEFIIDSFEAAHIMARHESLLDQDRSFLNQILSQSLKTVELEEISARKVVKNIIARIRILVKSLTQRFEVLRKENFEHISDIDRTRYLMMFNREE